MGSGEQSGSEAESKWSKKNKMLIPKYFQEKISKQ
jgi:hypothetical protein